MQNTSRKFCAEKLRKGYKPIIGIRIVNYATTATRRYATRAITLNGEQYKVLFASLPMIARQLRLEGGLSNISDVIVVILNEGKESDFLRTDGLGYIQGAAKIFLIFDTGDTLNWNDRVDLFEGKIEDFSNITTNEIGIQITDSYWRLKGRRIGIPITAQDYPKASAEDIGKIIPIIYGDHLCGYGQDGELMGLSRSMKNNMVPTIYIGINANGKHEYLVAAHNLKNFNTTQYRVWMYDDRLRRFVKIEPSQVSGSYASELYKVEVDNLPYLYDYWYPINVYNINKWENAQNAIDNNWDTYADSVLNDSDPAGEYHVFTAGFANYDGYQTSVDFLAVKVFFKSNYYEANENDGKYELHGYGGDYDIRSYNSSTLSHITYPAPVISTDIGFYHEQLADYAGISHAWIYDFFQEIKYQTQQMFSVYIACQGMKYNSWINGRSVSDTDPNTGKYYSTTHPDDDGAGNLIENPVGVIESVLRDLLGFSDSDLELDSFNRAAAARDGWKFSFAITKQIDAVELLNQLAYECQCFLFWNYAGRMEILAFEPNLYFTNSGKDVPISSDIYTYLPQRVALEFDGTTAAGIEYNGNTAHRITGDLTLECWLKVSNFNSVRVIAHCGTDSGSSGADNTLYYIAIEDELHIFYLHQYGLGNAEDVEILLERALQANTWYHFILRRNTSTKHIIVDIYDIKGALYSQGYGVYNTAPSGGSNSWLILGNSVDMTNPFSGALKEMRIWNTLRSNSDIEQNGLQILSGAESGLVGYWRLDEGANKIAYDLTATGANGAIGTGCDWLISKTDIPDLNYYAQHPIVKDSLRISCIPTKQLANDITLRYFSDYMQGEFQESYHQQDSASQTKYGVKEMQYEAQFIRDATTAGLLGDLLLYRNSEKFYTCRFKTWLNAADILEGDVINIRHPLLDSGIFTTMQMNAARWLVIGLQHNLSVGEIEIEALLLAFPS